MTKEQREKLIDLLFHAHLELRWAENTESETKDEIDYYFKFRLLGIKETIEKLFGYDETERINEEAIIAVIDRMHDLKKE